MSEKFMDGPWEYDDLGQFIWQTTGKSHGALVADVRGWGYLTGAASPAKVPEEEAMAIQEANGHLIAAAPEMYEAIKVMCRNAIELGHCNPSDCYACKTAAAVKKARGAA